MIGEACRCGQRDSLRRLCRRGGVVPFLARTWSRYPAHDATLHAEPALAPAQVLRPLSPAAVRAPTQTLPSLR